jgi:hypothetical protein
MRWGVAIAYSILLLLGFAIIMQRQSTIPAGLVATRDLAPDRLLQAGDVAPSGRGMQYVRRDLKAGDVLQPGDLVSFPALNWEEETVPVAFAVERELVEAGLVNAGMTARICKGSIVAFEFVPVRAVLCWPGEAACIAITAIPTDKPQTIAQAFGKSPALRLRPMQTNSTC